MLWTNRLTHIHVAVISAGLAIIRVIQRLSELSWLRPGLHEFQLFTDQLRSLNALLADGSYANCLFVIDGESDLKKREKK